MKNLAIPTADIMDRLRSHTVIECGAGNGLWQQIMLQEGITSVGLDKHSGGAFVRRGDHRELHRYKQSLLLVVWPPDNLDLSKWISAWGGTALAICGDFSRFTCPDFKVMWSTIIKGGRKGDSEFRYGEIVTPNRGKGT